MGGLSPTHLGLILLAFIVLFGYKRLPDASRSLGRSLRILKAETKGLQEDGHAPRQGEAPQVEGQQYVQQPVQYAQQPVQYAQQPVQHAQQPVQYAQVPAPVQYAQVPVQASQPPVQPSAPPVQYVQVPVDPTTGLPVAGYIPPAVQAPHPQG